ncbi:hypothetical protein ANN_09909 [Periplaneta americana]|uniref:DUF4817 domain-containing protein n=1 Tax=Periplaneta americana TaxID=6978 RepID=A0ABQ8TR88_PERAM|nr:hypothetical protein ANN_09909 [Periplaneta americana]
MFAITYVCEKLFSTMKIVKTKFRSRLTDKYLRDQLRLAAYMVSRKISRRYATRKSETSTNGTEFDSKTVDDSVYDKLHIFRVLLHRELPAWLSRSRRLPANLKLRSVADSILAWTDYLVGFFRGFSKPSLPSKETLKGHSDSSFRGEGYIQCCVGVRLCDMYSNQEMAEIHFMYGKADGNAALARRLYQERYPQRQCPDRKTFTVHYRLCENGKFNSPGLGRGRPRSITPKVQEEILEAVNMTPSISTRRVALQVNVPHTTVWRLLKEYQLYPYHFQRVQTLSVADYPARVRFCQWFLQQCGVNPNFPALVLFTDEAQFTRDGITNFHNQHVFENPRATVPSHHQVRFSLIM